MTTQNGAYSFVGYGAHSINSRAFHLITNVDALLLVLESATINTTNLIYYHYICIRVKRTALESLQQRPNL